MAVGAMGIVAPISALSAAIPFTVGIASGERPGVLQVVGIALALRASRWPRASRPTAAAAPREGSRWWPRSASLYFVFLDRAAEESVPWAVSTARGTSSVLAIGAALALGASLRPGAAHLPALVFVGLCDVGANVLFGLASTRGFLSIVSVLAALYPVVTVALAAVLLHERIAATSASASPAPSPAPRSSPPASATTSVVRDCPRQPSLSGQQSLSGTVPGSSRCPQRPLSLDRRWRHDVAVGAEEIDEALRRSQAPGWLTRLERTLVVRARSQGRTWSELARPLGISKQAVRQRHLAHDPVAARPRRRLTDDEYLERVLAWARANGHAP